jgi:hypothetical protein
MDQTYVVQAVPQPRSWNSQQGGPMLSYDITVADPTGATTVCELAQKSETAAPTVGQQLLGQIVTEYGRLKFKKAYQSARSNGGARRDPETEKRITRQHSQSAAIELLKLSKETGESVADLLGKVKTVADRLDQDAYGGQQAAPPAAPTQPPVPPDVPPPPVQQPAPQTGSDDDIPFHHEPFGERAEGTTYNPFA